MDGEVGQQWRTTVEKHLDHGAREIPAMSLQDIVLSKWSPSFSNSGANQLISHADG